MSELIQVCLNKFSVHQIRASPYHPQTNGACERFSGTLKTMIRSLSLLDIDFLILGTLPCHGLFLHTAKFPSRPWAVVHLSLCLAVPCQVRCN